MAKDKIFEEGDVPEHLTISDPDEGYSLRRFCQMFEDNKYKNVIFDFDFKESLFMSLQDQLDRERYRGDWMYLRMVVARGKLAEPVVDVQMVLDSQFEMFMRFVLAWTDYDFYPNCRKEEGYSEDAIEDMQFFVRETHIAQNAQRVIYLEVDVVYVSHTFGFRNLFPTVTGLVLRTTQSFDEVFNSIDFLNLFYVCEEFGFHRIFVEVNDTELKEHIIALDIKATSEAIVSMPELNSGFIVAFISLFIIAKNIFS